MQIGKVSIIGTINKYKINRTYAFTAYAVNTVKINLYRLTKIYKPSVIKNAVWIYINGHEVEDLVQIGMMALIKAINKYQLDTKIYEEDFILKEKITMLMKAMERLTEDERKLIDCLYFKNRSLKEYGLKKSVNDNILTRKNPEFWKN